ncbi:MAG: helix-turn-helix domain-containing protein [Atopobiaceae bacterium]|nr:helix-turn-helix domain-containing protein [Atopobiaceae bacterium]
MSRTIRTEGTMECGEMSLAAVCRPLKTAEVAECLGQTPRNILRMVQNGQIPAKRLGSQWYYSPKKIAELVGMDDE